MSGVPELRWPSLEESRRILADYVEQHEVADDGVLPEDPDLGDES
jgi:hypothetical protein